MLKKTVIIISTGLGFGYSPVAPGTAGSVLGVVIAFIYAKLTGRDGFTGAWYAAAIVLVLALGIWASGYAEVIFEEKDSGKIVIDEVAGMLLTLYLLPFTWFYLLGGFLAFRFFDIVKPFPARRIDQRLGGGPGVMLDDIVAGIYANLCLHAVKAALH